MFNRTKSKAEEAREWELANKAMMKRLGDLGYTQDDLESYIRWEIQQSESTEPRMLATAAGASLTSEVTSQYPDTSERVLAAVASSVEMNKFYPEVNKIIEMTNRIQEGKAVPVPLAQNCKSEEASASNDELSVIESMITQARDQIAFEDTQKMDKVRSIAFISNSMKILFGRYYLG